jgi:hypothetical protein
MVFLKTRPYVKLNNAEFTNVYSFTLLLMCSTHFILSFRKHFFFPPPTIVSLVYSEITWMSAWQVLLRIPSLALEGQQNLTHFDSGLLLSRTFLPHAGSSCTYLCLYLVPCTQKRFKFSRYSATYFDHLQLYSELSYNWDTGLPFRCLLWIYCTAHQHKANLFPCVFSSLTYLYLQFMCHGSYQQFAQGLSFHTCTIPPVCWLTLFQVFASPF